MASAAYCEVRDCLLKKTTQTDLWLDNLWLDNQFAAASDNLQKVAVQQKSSYTVTEHHRLVVELKVRRNTHTLPPFRRWSEGANKYPHPINLHVAEVKVQPNTHHSLPSSCRCSKGATKFSSLK